MGNAASTRIRANNKWEGAPTVEHTCWQKLTNDLNYIENINVDCQSILKLEAWGGPDTAGVQFVKKYCTFKNDQKMVLNIERKRPAGRPGGRRAESGQYY